MFYLLSLLTTILFVPSIIFAQGYEPIVGIPGIANPNSEFGEYINTLYALSIAVAGLLAVVKLVIAGVKYMMTDIVTSKGEAKKDIQGALLGLLVVLAAVLILTIINRDITEADIQMTPAAEIPRPPEPPPTVVVNPTLERGYRWIPQSADVSTRNSFYLSCSGTIRIVSSEIRCFEMDPANETALRDSFLNTPNPPSAALLDILVEQFRDFVNPLIIDDPALVSAIITETGATGSYFIMERLPTGMLPTYENGFPPGYDSQAEGLCRAYATANNLEYGSEVSLEPGEGYFACVY